MIVTEAAKAARRAYKREWNRKHPDQVRQHQENYWAKRAAQQAAADPAPDTASGSAGGAEE